MGYRFGKCLFEMSCITQESCRPDLSRAFALLARADPSLAFDISAYGLLGYDQSKGPPNDDAPVQKQYRGTWELWRPANYDPRIGELLATQVISLLDAEI